MTDGEDVAIIAEIRLEHVAGPMPHWTAIVAEVERQIAGLGRIVIDADAGAVGVYRIDVLTIGAE